MEALQTGAHKILQMARFKSKMIARRPVFAADRYNKPIHLRQSRAADKRRQPQYRVTHSKDTVSKKQVLDERRSEWGASETVTSANETPTEQRFQPVAPSRRILPSWHPPACACLLMYACERHLELSKLDEAHACAMQSGDLSNVHAYEWNVAIVVLIIRQSLQRPPFESHHHLTGPSCWLSLKLISESGRMKRHESNHHKSHSVRLSE